MTLEFQVWGVAQPKGSMKAFYRPGMKFPIVTDSNRSAKSWAQLVAEGANHALAQLPPADRGVLEGPVRLSMAFYLPRPKKFAKRADAAHLTAPDWDKLARCVGDSLTHVCYRDDKQVVEAVVGKFYAGIGEPPHVTVRVESTGGVRPMAVRPAPLPLFAEALA
ncbi:MAG TPA: RusA family crossover junction endodeoxyribonuclease [Gemmatimonadaceae bacterium]|jgi:Holliday junction resolvase RusA-like endonuclease|nr:RusA family crossover junction endodeoxyribonuclease [Gemmatimonadaceae bacterium]